MSTTNKADPKIDAAINTVNAMVDSLTEKFYHLGKVAHLAAFAMEARRTLEIYSSQADYYPEFKNSLKNCTESVNNWRCFDDTTSDVLQQIAYEIDACSNAMSDGTQCVRNLRSKRMNGGA